MATYEDELRLPLTTAQAMLACKAAGSRPGWAVAAFRDDGLTCVEARGAGNDLLYGRGKVSVELTVHATATGGSIVDLVGSRRTTAEIGAKRDLEVKTQQLKAAIEVEANAASAQADRPANGLEEQSSGALLLELSRRGVLSHDQVVAAMRDL